MEGDRGGLDCPRGHARGLLVADQHRDHRSLGGVDRRDIRSGQHPTDASLFTVVLLFVLGNALSRRIRFALWIVIFVFQLVAVLLGLIVAIYLLSGQSGEITINNTSDRVRLGLTVFEGGTGLVLGILLWKARSAFPARVGRGSRLAGAAGVRWWIDRLGARGDRPHRGVPQ